MIAWISFIKGLSARKLKNHSCIKYSQINLWRGFMAKRFSDSNKWRDSWFFELSSDYKLLWLYLLDECDHAGIWKKNIKIAAFMIGVSLSEKEILDVMQDRIIILDDKNWFIPKFVDFQYGALNKKNKVHNSVMQLLDKFNISYSEKLSPLEGPIQAPCGNSQAPCGNSYGAKDKDKEKDKVMDKDKDKEKEKQSICVKCHGLGLVHLFETEKGEGSATSIFRCSCDEGKDRRESYPQVDEDCLREFSYVT